MESLPKIETSATKKEKTQLMENLRMIYKIRSKYILRHIINYIGEEHYALKLFCFSKILQNRLTLDYSTCYQKYLNSLNFNLYAYLLRAKWENTKNILKVKYDYFISKNQLNKEKFEKIIYEVIKNVIIKKQKIYINIESPLFEMLSKTKIFDENFIIRISQENIDKYEFKEDYKNIFNKLNTANIKYSSIIYVLKEIKKLDYLKEINIKNNGIRKMMIEYNGDEIIDNESLNNRQIKLDLFNNLETLTLLGKNENKIKLLENVNFKELKELKELILHYNNFADIKVLEKVKFNKLEKLDLENCNILDINILGNVNFKELKQLNLANNKISDIKVLGKVQFNKLEKLSLRCNKISDINILENVNFEKLKDLDLSHNSISDIRVLEKVKFDKLQSLDISDITISDISFLENTDFPELKYLYLDYNKISDIKVLKKVKFYKLERLCLENNEISDINILENINLKELKEIDLSWNKISDIKVLGKMQFDKLETLCIQHNEIDNNKYSSIINSLKSKLKKFHI